MHTALPQKTLEEMFDETVREVTEQETGIQLCLEDANPRGNFYTVHIDFEKGFHSSISLCAEVEIMIRLTQNMMQEENVTWQDIEDFTKEFFNVLCGQIAARLFEATGIASRFGIPLCFSGYYWPEKHKEHFSLRYASDRNERVRLIHHTPVL